MYALDLITMRQVNKRYNNLEHRLIAFAMASSDMENTNCIQSAQRREEAKYPKRLVYKKKKNKTHTRNIHFARIIIKT